MIFLHLVCNFGSSEQTTRGATAAAANTPASQAQISLLSCPLLTLVARSSPGACFQQKPRPSSSNLRCRLSIVKRAKLFKQKSFSLTLANRIISFFFSSQEWSLLLLPRICFLCTYQRWHTMGWGFKISKLLKSIFFFMWGRDFFFFHGLRRCALTNHIMQMKRDMLIKTSSCQPGGWKALITHLSRLEEHSNNSVQGTRYRGGGGWWKIIFNTQLILIKIHEPWARPACEWQRGWHPQPRDYRCEDRENVCEFKSDIGAIR